MADYLVVSSTESSASSSVQAVSVLEEGKYTSGAAQEPAATTVSALGVGVKRISAAVYQDRRFRKLVLQSATEFLGMFIFIFLALGNVQSAVKTNASVLATDPSLAYIQIAIGFGCGDPLTFLSYTIAQMAGATAACGTVAGIFPGDFKGANQVFSPTSVAQAFFLEVILTFGLVLTVLFLAVEKSKITFYAPMMIGVYVFVAHLIAIPYTNTSINPARSFGASIVAGIWNYHWIFWIAPLLGGAIAGVIYRGYKLIDYEKLNPGQDADA
ncbi:hypothetical protein HK100_012204 [Physocladia obscura]|uniref:Aquaporin-like protein n=1 Tax=Physocladia obscura TaxID=109957 RepID=A0AAD5T972_9FUNG|nr:hypothetical protein HK100_012204 [Physocladia obscura]